MIDKETQRQIESQWRMAQSIEATDAQRLEAMINALLLTMRSTLNAVDAVQSFWDNAQLLDKLIAAADGTALDDGGTITKEAVIKYQGLFNSFKKWSSATTVTIAGEDLVLPATPRQLFARQPEKVS